MEYRNCRKSDIEACAKILADAYAQPPYNEEWELGHAQAYLERFFSFDPSLCFVAINQQSLAGAIFAYSYPWHGGENCYIQEFFVSPLFQGMKIGKGLISKLSSSKQGQSSWLVANQNAKAIEFYKSLGFSDSGPYKFYHGPI